MRARRRTAAGRRRGVRRVPRPRAARRGQRLAGPAPHLPRHRPHADRRGGRRAPRGDRERRWPSSWAGGSVPHSVSVFGSAGFTGALTARLLYRHPSLELKALTARSDVGRRLDDLYPHHRVPLELEELDLDRHADVDAAVVAYPARRRRAARGRAARAGRARRRPQRRLPPARPRGLRAAGTASTRRRSCSARPSTASPSSTARRSAAPSLVANPGCYPTASLLALAPLARAGRDRGRGHRREVRGVGRWARRHREDPLRDRRRERERVRRPAPPTHPRRSSRSSRYWIPPTPTSGSRSSRTSSRSTRASWCPAT